MSNKAKTGAPKVWAITMGLGIVGCLAGMAYSFYALQQKSGEEAEYRVVVDEMRELSHQITQSARESVRGDESTFRNLEAEVAGFETRIEQIQSAGLYDELSQVDVSWQPVKRAAMTLVEAGPRIVFINEIAGTLQKNIGPMQREFTEVVEALRSAKASPDTLVAAQKTLWLTERISRNVEGTLAGGSGSQVAADEFRTDSAEFIRLIEALTRGDKLSGIDKVESAGAIDSLSAAFRMFSPVSTSVERIAGAAPELRQAAVAREALLESEPALTDAVSALVPAIDRLALGSLYDRGTLLTLFVLPAVFGAGLLLALYRRQRQRVLSTEQGFAQINGALLKFAEGDLTVQVGEDNPVTANIAREINASIKRQRELIGNVRTPFEQSVEEINKIGITARGQVEKARDLSRSVSESTSAATEMVRTSEEIKSATADAAQTAERNCQQVAQGYELTKDMSKASADVRESVQETSKSAKRQSELIQSVTAAAEYIQALNTKISVVAINTRIEAEKAGEYGRPFLGIAESIADLLREAEEEGRKIISEVRMLQNMSAENLASMEHTVATVVTILQYIERLDSSLEEINAGSAAISSIIRTVDEAAGQSAASALHMNNSMARMREGNLEIGKFSESSQVGVTRLQKSMRDASESLRQFRIDGDAGSGGVSVAELDELERVRKAKKVSREDEAGALEVAGQSRATV